MTLVLPITDTKAVEPATLEQLFDLIGAGVTNAGVNITPETAMQCPAVRSCTQLIATVSGTLPAKVFKRQGEGKTVAADHPASTLLSLDANPWTAATVLRSQLVQDAILHGGGFALAVRGFDGTVAELHRLDPRQVEVVVDGFLGEPSYVYRSRQSVTRYSFADIVHVVPPGGRNIIRDARETISLALALEGHFARLAGSGARPSGLLIFEKPLSDKARDRISASWHAAHSGANVGKTAVVEEGATFQQLTYSSVDLQFMEARAQAARDICTAFGVPPSMVGDLARATWSNIEHQNLMFVQTCLLPWIDSLETAFRRVLIAPEDRKSTSIEFIVEDLLRGDIATRTEAYAKFRAMGVLSINEIRALEDLPPVEGGDDRSNPNTTAQTAPAPEAASAVTESEDQ